MLPYMLFIVKLLIKINLAYIFFITLDPMGKAVRISFILLRTFIF